MATPTDPLFGNQDFFNVIGDIQTIWDQFNGDGVVVAVYDDGVEYTHPDLAGNYDASLHFQNGGTTYDPFPIASGDGHGTACAGIIGSVGNNGVGGAGVAWGVTLTAVNILEGPISANQALFETALAYGQMYDVMSNSWGRTPFYGTYQSLMIPASSVYGEVFDGMEVAIENGRDGLGTIIVQAAGNDTLDANADGINAVRYTTSVAATELNGFVADYSNYGASILVAAPADNYTTDRAGGNGYTGGDYVDGFNGTSAATPVVSGIVALMLEANAGLGWRDVQNILAISASHTGSAYGGPAGGFEQSAWGSNYATNWNGGGMTFNSSYGFGMVDAFAAVRMAEAWLVMNGDAQTSANEVTATYTRNQNLAINDFATMTSTISVTGDMYVEDVTVRAFFTHTYVGDLEITLTGPNGESIVLTDNQGGGTDITAGWYFGITSLLGTTSIAGTWTLSIRDTADGDTGSFTGWALDFHGEALDVNDVHHITEDFLTYRAVEAGRWVISDTNGGADDWLNMAAISGNVSLSLAAGGSINVNGVNWASISGGTSIENAYLGDGNDTVTGSMFGNEIHGARGSDSLFGGAGNDTLFGGAGNDMLYGGNDNDHLIGGEDADYMDGGLGIDLASYLASTSGVTVDLRAGATGVGGDAQGDTFVRIENVTGSNYHDSLTGNIFNNRLVGRNGNDRLEGLGGNDDLVGGNGNDHLIGGAGADDLDGGAGIDLASYVFSMAGVTVDLRTGISGIGGDAQGDTFTGIENVTGSNYDDTLTGNIFNNRLVGRNGNDTLSGLSGNDALFGGNGFDHLIGGAGADELNGGNGIDLASYLLSMAGVTVDIRAAATGIGGDAQGDTYVSIENVTGSNFSDNITGNMFNNRLVGRNGNDTLAGMAGNDSLNGGLGIDTFVYANGHGHDTIEDFDATNGDIIDLSGLAGFSNFASLTAPGVMTQTGADVLITFSATESILLKNVLRTDLDASDFDFV